MRLRSASGIAVTAAAVLTGAALFVAAAQGARMETRLTFVVQNRGTEYVTAGGSTSVFPGRLETGDRIFTRDALLEGGRSVGYDNEVCTVTFDNNDLCQVMLVLPGRGQIQATWLWIDRNASTYGPSRFAGVIDGGTGSFAHATGQFTATLLANGAPRVTAALR